MKNHVCLFIKLKFKILSANFILFYIYIYIFESCFYLVMQIKYACFCYPLENIIQKYGLYINMVDIDFFVRNTINLVAPISLVSVDLTDYFSL